MKEQLRLLVELQRLDSAIMAKGSLIGAMPSKLSRLEKPVEEARARLEQQRQKFQAAEKKKKEKERELEETGDRINKLKARTADIKDNKTYQAHLKEIEAVEKTRYGIEDEILLLMEAIEAEAKEIKSVEAMVKTESQKVDAEKKKLDDEKGEIEGEMEGIREKRKEAAASIDPDTYELYMTLLASGRGLAVVEAKDEVCRGCNMNIMPQLFVELKSNERIIQCPQCKRILYYGEK